VRGEECVCVCEHHYCALSCTCTGTALCRGSNRRRKLRQQ
jgi:hypothetical protein